jgi:hypothetical protein
VFDTLALSYGTIGAETIMYEENYDKYRSIRSFIKEQFYMSIENDISDKDLIIEL